METLDTRHILRGFDGKLYSDGEFLAQVPEWNMQLNFNETDYQPAGSELVAGVYTGFSQTLSFTETHITDELLEKLFEYTSKRLKEPFEFVGMLERADGDTGEYVCRSCEPSGSIDVAKVASGGILDRAWTWRVNEKIDPQKYLGRPA